MGHARSRIPLSYVSKLSKLAMLEVLEAARVGGGSGLLPEPPSRGNSTLVCDQSVI